MNIHYRWSKLSCLAATTSVAALGLGSHASLPAAQAAEEVSIAQVQGTTDVSPLASRSVTTTGTSFRHPVLLPLTSRPENQTASSCTPSTPSKTLISAISSK